jgi:hypothetical protein
MIDSPSIRMCSGPRFPLRTPRLPFTGPRSPVSFVLAALIRSNNTLAGSSLLDRSFSLHRYVPA